MREKNKYLVLGVLFFIIGMLNIIDASSGGGATIPISTISLTEQGNTYDMTPGRLKFEFEKQWYAIQLRRVKEGYVDFVVMNLDENNLEDITAYEIIEDIFRLNLKESGRIDLNGDNAKDIIIELDEIIKGGRYGTVRSADFSIKKISGKDLVTLDVTSSETIILDDSNEQGSISGNVLSEEVFEDEESQNQIEETIEVVEEDVEKDDKGHGNDLDGCDEDNPGKFSRCEDIIEESVSENQIIKSDSVVILSQESKEKLIFLERLINFFKELFD